MASTRSFYDRTSSPCLLEVNFRKGKYVAVHRILVSVNSGSDIQTESVLKEFGIAFGGLGRSCSLGSEYYTIAQIRGITPDT